MDDAINQSEITDGNTTEPEVNPETEPEVDPTVPEADWSYKAIDSFYERVRGVLYASSIKSLTDEMIDMPERAPAAERIIKGLVPLWETYQAEDPERFKLFESCIVYKTAMFFEQYVQSKQPKRMQSSSINIEYSTSGNIKQSPLYTLKYYLDELLLQLSEEDGQTFFGFRVTGGV